MADDGKPGAADAQDHGPGPSGSAEVRDFAAAGRGKKCPLCSNPVTTRYRPFCSKRCAELDLGRWLREDYRIPAEEPPDPGGEGEPDPGRDASPPTD